jgi:YesN/AraC family two-component response regulator
LATGRGGLPTITRKKNSATQAFARVVKIYEFAITFLNKNISPDYLNKVCHRLMKTSTKALINDAVIYELKRLLAETDLTVEQIAAQMNYDNVSYLCRFFRNATGQSMMEFRRKQR